LGFLALATKDYDNIVTNGASGGRGVKLILKRLQGKNIIIGWVCGKEGKFLFYYIHDQNMIM
jgi:hypothetical protein